MVHKKYIHRGGKTYGPYYYESYRENGKVKNRYLTHLPEENSSFFGVSKSRVITAGLLLAIMLISFMLWNFYPSSTGNAVLNVYTTYNPGENLDGSLKLVLQPGELIPADSAVLLTLGNVSKSYLLSELISPPSTTGSFYASGTSLSGEGTGYGAIGTKVSAPVLSFTLRVSSQREGNKESAEDENKEAASNESQEVSKEDEEGKSSEVKENKETNGEKTQEKKESKEEGKSEEAVKKEEGKGSVSEEKEKEEGKAEKSVTGNAVSGERVVSGSVSADSPFVYTLEEGERAELVSGSVKKGEVEMSDGLVNLETNGNEVSVSTEYTVTSEGYGSEYTEGKERTIEVDLGKLGIEAQAGKLEIRIVSGDAEIVKVEKEISVKEPAEEENETVIEEVNVTLGNESLLNETETNVTLISNETVGNATVKTTRGKIRLGERVKWVKNVTVNEVGENVRIELPGEAENVSVKKRNEGTGREEEADAVISELTGQVVSGEVTAEIDTERHSALMKFFKSLMGVFTGKVVDEGNLSQEGAADGVVISISENDTATRDSIASASNDSGSLFNETGSGSALQDNEGLSSTNDAVEVVLIKNATDNATEYVIEYYTDAPVAYESNRSDGGKDVIISGPDGLNYTDVVSYTSIEETLSVGQEGGIRVYWQENGSFVAFDAYDEDNNTKLDYLEWVTPHLSNQTFNITFASTNTTTANLTQDNDYWHLTTSSVAPYNSLVGYWSFDGDNRTTTAFDWVGVNNGAYTGGAYSHPNSTVCLYNDCSHFDGSNDYISVPDAAALDLTTTGTVTMWFSPVTQPGSGNVSILQKGDGLNAAYPNGYAMEYIHNAGCVGQKQLRFDVGTGADYYTRNSCGALTLGRWYFVAGVWNSSRLLLYVNTTKIGGASAYADGFLPANDYPLVIGAGRGLTEVDGFFNGNIDEVMVFNTDLTPAQITDIYNNQSSRFNSRGTLEASPIGITSGKNQVNVSVKSYKRGIDTNISLRIGERNSTAWNYTAYQNLSGNSSDSGSTNLYNINYLTTNISPSFLLTSNSYNFSTPLLASTTTAMATADVNDDPQFQISACGTLSAAGGQYVQTANIVPSGASDCITISASNVTFDGNGYTIYNSTYARTAIITQSQSNVTIKNAQINISGYLTGAIYFTNTPYSSVLNTTIFITASSTPGIYFESGTNANTTIVNNTISVSGGSSKGIQVERIYNSTIAHNKINVSGSGQTGIMIGFGDIDNVIYNNTILVTSGSAVAAIFININVNGTRFISNTINASGSGAEAFYIEDAVFNSFINNTILQASGDAFQFSTDALPSSHNNFTGNNLSNIGGNWLNVIPEGLNHTSLIDQELRNYAFAGVGGRINVQDTRFGEIRFLDTVNGSGANLSDMIRITNNSAYVNATISGGGTLNKSANVTLYGIGTGYTDPVVLRDGAICNVTFGGGCANFTSLNAGTVQFNVTGWSTYSVGERPDLQIPTSIIFVTPTVANGANLTIAQILVNVTATDDTSISAIVIRLFNSTEARININSTTGSPNYQNYSYLADGVYRFNATVNDSQNNKNDSATRLVRIDTTIPNMDFGQGTETNASLLVKTEIFINITATDSGAGLSNITITLINSTGAVKNSTTFTSSPAVMNTTGLPSGVYHYNATAVDAVSLRNSTLTRSATLDAITPSSIIFVTPTEASGVNFSRSFVLVNVTGTDDTSISAIVIRLFNSTGARININSTTTSPNYQNYSGLIDGTYYFNATVNDTANNKNDSATRVVILDTAIPNMVFNLSTEENGTTISRNQIIVNVTANDSGVGVANITITLYNASGVLNVTVFTGNAALFNRSGLADGTYYFNATAVDLLSQRNNTVTRTVTLDTQPITVTLNSPANRTQNASGLSMLFNVSLNKASGAVVFYTLDSWANNKTMSAMDSRNYNATNLTILDGVYTARFFANDTAGNINNTVSVTFSVDQTYPTVFYNTSTETNGTTIQRGNVVVNVTAADGFLQAVVIRLFNASMAQINTSVTSTSPNFVNFTGLSDGVYYFNSTVNDSAGNVNGTELRMVTIDTVVLGVTIVRPTSAGNFTLPMVFNVTLNKAGPSVRYSLDGGINNVSMSSTAARYNATNLTILDGTYTLNVYANDSAGNLNTTSSVVFTIDSTVPVPVYATPTPLNGSTGRDSLMVNVTVTESRFANVTFTLHNASGLYNQTTLNVTTFALNFTSLADGTYFYNVTVVDGSGNRNSTALRTYLVDTQLPSSIEFTSPTETDLVNLTRSELYVNVTGTDATQLQKIVTRLFNVTGQINSSVTTSSPNFINFSGLRDGQYWFNATVNDTAGNKNESSTRTVKLDTTKPTPYYGNTTEVDAAVIGRTNIQINVTVTDNTEYRNMTLRFFNASGILNTTFTNLSSYQINYTGLLNGTYQFNATAVDFVGLENSTVTRTVEIQTSALVLEFIGQTEGDGTNLSKNELIVNATVTNRTAIETLVVRLYNVTGAVNYSATAGTKLFVNWTGLADGRYYFNASANDTSGNAIAAGTRTVLLDTVNPLMTYGVGSEVSGENKSRNWVYVNVSVTDTNEANITFYLSNSTGLVNATVYLGGNRSINFTGLSDGVYTYNATIVDQAGNRNSTSSRTITLDTINPLISFGVGTAANGSARSQNWTYMNLSVTETNEFNVTFSLFNRSTMLNYTTGVAGNRSLNFTGLADGTYFYNVTVRDYAGNTNVTELRTIVLDTAKPTSIAFAAPTETDLVNLTRSNLMVNVTATDSANVAYILIRLYNGSRALVESSTSTSGAASWFVNFSLGDNLYYFNATVNDTAGNTNDTATRQVIVDTASPTLLGSSAPDVVRYGNASIEVNASDLGTGLAYGNANVTYPNGTATNYGMTLSASTFRLVIANMTLIGDYDVNVTFNDTLGHLNTTLLKFEVYNVAANISGGGTDALGNLRNYSYTFLRPGSDVVLFNLTNSSYNLTSREVKQRDYDLAVTLASQTVLLRNLTLNTTFIPVNLDNLTGIDTNITNYKVLAGLAVNSTYTGTATVNLSYSGLYDSSSAAVAESGLTVHKCSTWNFTGRSCVNGSFALQSEKWIAAGADQALVNTTSFSAFIVTEYTCGNSICQAAYGEDTTTCSADCSSGSSGGSSGGGSSGGGGVATTATQAEKEKEKEQKQIDNPGTGALQVNVPRIERELTVGDQLPEQLTFTNTLTMDQEITFTMDARLRSVLFAPEKVTVKAGESLNVPLLINGTKEGVYIGKLQITSAAGTQVIPVKIVTLSKESKLLDLSVTIPVDRIAPNKDMVFKVEAYNLGQLRQYEVLLQYDIVNKNTNQSVLHQEETTSVGAVLSLLKTIHIPEAVPEGNYRLVVTAVYDENQASAFASFAVEKSLFSTFFKDYAALGLMILVVGFMLFAGFYYLFALRKKIFEQKMQEKKKNSIYPFPDFNLLPKSGYAYVGHVADADEKTYLDYTQLNRHTLIAGGTGSGKTVAGMVAVEELLKKGGSAVVFDPVGQWTGFAKRNGDAAMLKLYKKFGLRAGAAYRPTVFTIDDATLNIDVVHYLKRKGLTVFRMDKLTPKKADIFIENCLAKIYRADLSETSSLRSLVVLDEVHRLLPKYGGHRAYTKLEQAVREFRKWGIGLLMISQVLTDFKGAIRGNIGTEIQMHTRYEGDIKRVRERHGAEVSKLISRMPVGIGMVESTGYNKGQPYFIEFRPLLHSPFKLSEGEMKSLVRHEEPVLSEGVLAGIVEKKESKGKPARNQQKHKKHEKK